MYDVNTDEKVFVLKEAHSRAIHTLKFAQGSDYTGAHGDMYNIFGSSSLDNTLKLWDIRMQSPIRTYEEHVNRSLEIGFTFSPCMRYIVTGSEERCFAIYDLRVDKKMVTLNFR